MAYIHPDISTDSELSTCSNAGAVSAFKRPELWVPIWAVYVLSALAWMGYKDALLGFLCLAPT